jgi:C4-dicarboxylate transporter DctM subunit
MTDGTLVTIISLAVTFFFMMGVPVLLVIVYWIIGCSFVMGLTLDNLGAELLNVFNKGFALLAMPLFILTGDLINKSGIARRLSDFAYSCLGWLRGGLAMAAIGACGLFAAISGSNSATTATIGSMLHPEMVKGGYDERFSAATAAAGGTVGIIIPPSIIFIVYGFMMNLPISDLFVAGIIPGALMVLAMMLMAWIVCSINGWGYLIKLEIGRVIKTAIGAWLGFFAIGLVLWGIYTGKFSPTEAAGVTVGFCIIVALISYPLNKMMGMDAETPVSEKSVSSMFVVEGFTIPDIPSIVVRSAQITGILAPLIAASVVMQQILSLLGAQAVIGQFVTGMGGYYAVLATAMAIVFVAGMILESLPVTIILAPNLYVASGVTGVPYFRLLRYSSMYLISLLAVWILVAVMPDLSLMLLPDR